MSLDFLSGRQSRHLVLSIVLAALGYLAFALWGGWREVGTAFGAVGAGGIAITLALSLVNYGLRFVRWQCYLHRLDLVLAWVPSLRIYLAGFALTTTPGKAGEMLRGVFLKRHGLSYSRSIAAFISERLSDLAAIVLLTLPGLGVFPQGRSFTLVGAVCVLLGLLLLGYGGAKGAGTNGFVAGGGRLAVLIQRILAMLGEARACHTPWMLLLATTLSLVAWSSEAFAFYLVLGWLDFDVSPAFAFSVYALAMLAGALSFMPGGLGGAEAVMTGLLIWGGMEGAQAVAATVIIRLATLWFAVGIGIAALLIGRGVGGTTTESEV